MKRPRRPQLLLEIAFDPDVRWMVIDRFLRATPELKTIKSRLYALLDELREIVDYGLAEQLEEVVNELGGEQLDAAVVWAFREGFRAGLREGR